MGMFDLDEDLIPLIQKIFQTLYRITSEKMAPKCDMVVKKQISPRLIYFYLTPHISAVAF